MEFPLVNERFLLRQGRAQVPVSGSEDARNPGRFRDARSYGTRSPAPAVFRSTLGAVEDYN